MLDKINKSLLSNTKVNQWKNTSDSISWLKNINNKKQSSFINFDVENFYPSISEKLLIDALNFAVINKYNRTRSIHNYAIKKNPAFPEFRIMGQKNWK